MRKYFCDRCKREVDKDTIYYGSSKENLHELKYLTPSKNLGGVSLTEEVSIEICTDCYDEVSVLIETWTKEFKIPKPKASPPLEYFPWKEI